MVIVVGRVFRHFSSQVDTQGREVFDLGAFQKFAVECWGEDWIAIDYYLTDNKLTGVWFTETSSHLWQTNRKLDDLSDVFGEQVQTFHKRDLLLEPRLLIQVFLHDP